MYRVITGRTCGDLLPLYCVSLPVSLQGQTDTTALQAVWLSPNLCPPDTADISTHQIRTEQDTLGQRWMDERMD